MKKEGIGLVDLKTGEIIEDKVLFIGKRPYTKDKNFVKIFISFFYDVVADKEITQGPITLLLYLILRMDYNTRRIVIERPNTVIRDLKISRFSYYRWLNVLIKHKILKKIHSNIFELQDFLALKGTTYQLNRKSTNGDSKKILKLDKKSI